VGTVVPIAFLRYRKAMSFEWDYPGKIVDGVIEVTASNIDFLNAMVSKLCDFGLRHLHFLIPDCTCIIIEKLLNSMDSTAINKYYATIATHIEREHVTKMFESDGRLGQVEIVSDFCEDGIVGMRRLFDHSPRRINMIVNVKHYCEGLRFNSAFNRRVWVSEVMRYSWGRPDGPGYESLEELIMNDTNEIAQIIKDKVDICKDCEFRRVCYDTRKPIVRSGGGWYHASECNYNPYICKWSDEEGYRTLAECGVVSNAEGFSIDHDRIAAINAELWGE